MIVWTTSTSLQSARRAPSFCWISTEIPPPYERNSVCVRTPCSSFARGGYPSNSDLVSGVLWKTNGSVVAKVHLSRLPMAFSPGYMIAGQRPTGTYGQNSAKFEVK
ncbi:hypothetical protein ACGC1H_007281 [Rhizoctonia solani]